MMYTLRTLLAGTVVVAAVGGCKESSHVSITRDVSVAFRDPGAQRSLEAELTPARVVGDRLELTLDLASHFPGDARARWAVEIADDAGHAVGPATIESPVALTGGGKASARIATPAKLADGFYVVRVTAVAKSGAVSDAAVLERYLEVRGHEVTPIDSDDYHTRSRALMGGVL
jgi:hypothetical protein